MILFAALPILVAIYATLFRMLGLAKKKVRPSRTRLKEDGCAPV